MFLMTSNIHFSLNKSSQYSLKALINTPLPPKKKKKSAGIKPK